MEDAHLLFILAAQAVLWTGLALGWRERRRAEELAGTRPAPYEWPKPPREAVSLFNSSKAARYCAITSIGLFAISAVLFVRHIAVS